MLRFPLDGESADQCCGPGYRPCPHRAPFSGLPFFSPWRSTNPRVSPVVKPGVTPHPLEPCRPVSNSLTFSHARLHNHRRSVLHTSSKTDHRLARANAARCRRQTQRRVFHLGRQANGGCCQLSRMLPRFPHLWPKDQDDKEQPFPPKGSNE